MDLSIPSAALTELAAAYLQAAVTLGLAGLSTFLYHRFRKPYFAVWALAWTIYALRLGAIVAFLRTGHSGWLYWHQVTTGWTALALLWAALVFSRGRPVWRAWYAALALFPPVWSYLAIYRMESFVLAAGPAVAFLSAATAWTAWAFLRYHREVGSPTARGLSVVLSLWAVHHLDYPFLRARGIWNPWGYYLDLLFELAMAAGILLLVVEDLDQGLRTLTSLSGELQQRGRRGEGIPEAVLRRALGLKGVHGSALYLTAGGGGAFVHGAGVCALWPYEKPPELAWRAVAQVRASRQPEVIQGGNGSARGRWPHPYTAALPILRGEHLAGALVVVGESRDPFTALDTPFLLAFGQQVGAALENEELYRSLEDRTAELERLQMRMVRQHEEERNRLSRELHDETAQVLAALNMQLGLLREKSDGGLAGGFDRAQALVGEGIRSIRSVTRNLRPTALDDLGLLSALRALARDFGHEGALEVVFDAPSALPPVGGDAELALYRTLQEGLANTVRHGRAKHVRVGVRVQGGELILEVADDGVGLPLDDPRGLNRTRGGLAGIRERIAGVGGRFLLDNRSEGGARLRVSVPVVETEQGGEP
jgi:signal transduction histidine kinase